VALGVAVRGLAGRAGRVEAVETDQGSLPTDLVLLATGLKPGSELAQRAGLRLGRTGAVAVNDRMRTDLAGVYAAGDCIETVHVVSGEKVHVPLALTANRTGRIAGANLAAEAMGQVSSQRFRGTAATHIGQVCGYALARTGLDAAEAQRAGFDPAVFRAQGHSRAAYYPGGTPLDLRIVVDRRTRRLLGAQILGQEGVAGRIDVLATALFQHMTVDEVYHLDLAYAPPFGPVYDPVIAVCGKAGLEL
jgi:NADPH-dependent 2,4-dienoyl-CoA reductase/sulfur reductase-like enzyme